MEDFPPWEFLVMKGGREGDSWIQAYLESDAAKARAAVDEAVQLLHGRRLAEAGEALSRAREGMATFEQERPDWAGVVGRWYFTAAAYESFLRGQHQAAWNDVSRARDCLREVVGFLPFLLPLAHHGVEFFFLEARIARAQRRWEVVKSFYRTICALAAGRDPLLIDRRGKPIYYSTLDSYVLSLPSLTIPERRSLEHILKHGLRAEYLCGKARQLYELDDILIPYP
ncbi:MAG: hypothetical protein AAF481_16075 [Acidobacteriota bacterium]